MKENPFDKEFSRGEEEHTREMDSITDDTSRGITPRDKFIELNSADDKEKTRMMDSIGASSGGTYYDDDLNDRPVKRRRRKKKKKINHTRTMSQIFLGVLLSVASLFVGVYLAYKAIIAIKDFTGMAKSSSQAEINIDDSMNIDEIADVLYENDIIEMPSLFKAYLRFSESKNKKDFLNGSYTLSANMSYSNIITALTTVKTYTETVTVTIPEGLNAQQIGQLLEENLVCRADDFRKYYETKQNKYDFEERIPENDNKFYYLEGYLFPDTYEFYVIEDLKKNPDFDTMAYAQLAADKMYKNFEAKITDEMYARMDELGFTLDEVITLASMVQKEGTSAENMSIISSVFQNRLEIIDEFPNLQSDATYTYINNFIKPQVPKGKEEEYIDIINAYDSYKCVGIPAGPICSPGMEAINAILYPADTEYYYFLASADGLFYYAQTHEQHEKNIEDAALREGD